MEIVKQTVRYINISSGKGIIYNNNGHLNVVGYAYTGQAGFVNDRHSTFEYRMFVGGKLVC